MTVYVMRRVYCPRLDQGLARLAETVAGYRRTAAPATPEESQRRAGGNRAAGSSSLLEVDARAGVGCEDTARPPMTAGGDVGRGVHREAPRPSLPGGCVMRVGDHVEVYVFRRWRPARVLRATPTRIYVEYLTPRGVKKVHQAWFRSWRS